jgi:hypothetical protein
MHPQGFRTLGPCPDSSVSAARSECESSLRFGVIVRLTNCPSKSIPLFGDHLLLVGELIMSLSASCLCGGVKFEINGPLLGPSNCHCSMCRKQHGAAFRSRARVQASDLKWVQGEDLVTFYESSPGTYRGFCRVCGSPIVNKFDERSSSAKRDPAATSRLGIALATLDDDPGVRPDHHIFVANKAPWFEITDGMPQFPESRLPAR